MAKVIKVNTSKNGKITSVATEPKTGVKTNTSKTTENVKSGTSNVSKVSNSTSQSTSTKSNTSENFFTAFKNLLTGNKSTSNTSSTTSNTTSNKNSKTIEPISGARSSSGLNSSGTSTKSNTKITYKNNGGEGKTQTLTKISPISGVNSSSSTYGSGAKNNSINVQAQERSAKTETKAQALANTKNRNDFSSDTEYENYILDNGISTNTGSAKEYITSKANENKMGNNRYLQQMNYRYNRDKKVEKYEEDLNKKKTAYETNKANDEDYDLDLVQYSDENGNTLSGRDYKTKYQELSDKYNTLIQAHQETGDDTTFLQEYQKLQSEMDGLSKYSSAEYSDTQLKSQLEENKTRLKEIKNRLNELQTTAQPNDVISPDNDKEIASLQAEAEELKKANETLNSKIEDVSTLKELSYYNQVMESGDKEAVEQLKEDVSHYHDNILERANSMVGGAVYGIYKAAVDVGTFLYDKGLELEANKVQGVANVLNKVSNGGLISNEEYEQIKSVADEMRSYEASDNEYRQQVEENLSKLNMYATESNNNVEQFVLEGLNSTSNFLIQFALLGEAGSLATMSVQSGSSRYYELKQQTDENGNQKYSDGQILANSIFTGLASYVTEKVGMDAFVNSMTGGVGKYLSGHAINYLTKSIANGALSEGGEELAEGVLDYGIDAVTLGLNNASLDPEELMYSFALGAFSGGLMSGVGASSYIVQTNQQYKNLKTYRSEISDLQSKATTQNELDYINSELVKIDDALNAFTDNSVTGGAVELEDLQQETFTNEDALATTAEAITPNIEQNAQVHNEIASLGQQIDAVTQGLLIQNGVKMDINQFEDLTPETREKTIKLAEQARDLGVDVRFNTDFSGIVETETETGRDISKLIEGVNINGTIVINPNSLTAQSSILAHEITHNLENTNAYKSLVNSIKDSKIYNSIRNNLTTIYDGVEGVDVDSETVASYIQNNLGNEEFVEGLVEYDNNLAKRVFKNIQAMFSTDEKVRLENTWSRAFEEYKKNSANQAQLAYSLDSSSEDYKNKQLEIIQENNPRNEELGNHTWVESVDDIHTFEDTVNSDNYETTPDFGEDDIKDALESGVVTVYSSSPIEQGAWVTPSKMEAQNYAGDGETYSKTINLNEVAWVDNLQGMYANVGTQDSIKFSLADDSEEKIQEKKNFIENTRKQIQDIVNTRGNDFSWADIESNKKLMADIESIQKVLNSWESSKAVYEGDEGREQRANEIAKEYMKELTDKGVQNGNAYIVIGPPASGKSSVISKYLQNELGAVEIDSDEIKTRLPEYQRYGGVMANYLHEESSDLAQIIQEKMTNDGYDVVLPLVGKNETKISNLIDELKAKGYTNIELYDVQLPIENSKGRAMARFVETGRYLSPEYLDSVGDKPTVTYDHVKNKEGVTYYAQYDNNVQRGQKAILVEEKGTPNGRGTIEGNSTNKGENQNSRDSLHGQVRGGESVQLRNQINENATNSGFLNTNQNQNMVPEVASIAEEQSGQHQDENDVQVGGSMAEIIANNSSVEDILGSADFQNLWKSTSQETHKNIATTLNTLYNSKLTAETIEHRTNGVINGQYQNAILENGAIEPGRNPRQDFQVPKSTENGATMQTARTIAETEKIMTKEIAPDFKRRVMNGEYSYDIQKNSEVYKNAESRLTNMGVDRLYNQVMGDKSINLSKSANMIVLMKELAKNNDTRVYDVMAQFSEDAHNSAQVVQITNMVKDSGPMGQLAILEKQRQQAQVQADKFTGGTVNIEIDENLKQDLLNATTDEERDSAVRKIKENIESQVPETLRQKIFDKVNAWRYLAMLSSPSTHIRNMAGNTAMGIMSGTKDVVGAVLEMGAEKIAKAQGKEFERTKAFVNWLSDDGKQALKLGDQAYDNVKSIMEGDDKYEKSKFGLKLIDKFNNGVGWALNGEDFIASKARFAQAYGGYLIANKVDLSNVPVDIAERATIYAIDEAKKATFRDYSLLAKRLNQISRDGGIAGFMLDSTLPFRQTPINVLKRGVEYSPIGLVETLVKGTYDVKKGNISATQFIDNLSSGLTGTGVALLGYFLAQQGLFHTKDDDKDRKQYFDEDNGEQDYSLTFDGGSYTIDWLTPAIIPLSIGAEVYNSIKSLDGLEDFNGFEAFYNACVKVADPIVSTTMLSNVESSLKTYADTEGEWFGDLISSAVTNYISQFFPTVLGKVAKSVDDTQRSTYSEKFGGKTWKKILNKIPFASKLNEASIDLSGNEKKNVGNNFFTRLAYNMFSPGYYSKNGVDSYDEELYRLYESIGDTSVFPSSSPNKTVSYNGESYTLTDNDYSAWEKTRWGKEKEYVDEFIDDDEYDNYTDEEKASIIDKIRSYAGEVAKDEFFKNRDIEYSNKTVESVSKALENDVSVSDYYITKDAYSNMSGDNKKSDYIDYLNDDSMSDKAKLYMYSQEYGDSKVYSYVSDMDWDDKTKLSVFEVMADTTADVDENGNTISNSKAKKVLAQYQELGVWDSIYEYVTTHDDVEWSSFGLTKTVATNAKKSSSKKSSSKKSSSKKSSSSSSDSAIKGTISFKANSSSYKGNSSSSGTNTSSNSNSSNLNLKNFTGANTVLNSSSKGEISQNGNGGLDDDYLDAYSKIFRKSLV